jgi:hypothetical protein
MVPVNEASTVESASTTPSKDAVSEAVGQVSALQFVQFDQSPSPPPLSHVRVAASAESGNAATQKSARNIFGR